MWHGRSLALAPWIVLVALTQSVLSASIDDEPIEYELLSENTQSSSTSVTDSVALLTTDRSDASQFCVGLLVSPHALLTQASCLEAVSNISWVFFGSTPQAFYEYTKPTRKPIPSPNNSSMNATVIPRTTVIGGTGDEPAQGEVGHVNYWVPVVKTTLHGEYVSGKARWKDVALVQLARPWTMVPPLPLMAPVNAKDKTAFNTTNVTIGALEGYRLSLDYLSDAHAPKLLPIRLFRKVHGAMCEVATRERNVAIGLGNICVVASVVEERTVEDFSYSFLMLKGKLAAIVSCTGGRCQATDTHSFLLVAAVSGFIRTHAHGDTWEQPDMRIIGGGSVELQGFIAGLRKERTSENFCTGSLISPRFVLTAAHCVDKVSFKFVSVGSIHVSSDEDGEQIRVKRVVLHPKHDTATNAHDTALVELAYISVQPPIVLDNTPESASAVKPGQLLTLYGYGPSFTRKMQLQQVQLPIVSRKECSAAINVDIKSYMMCAGGEADRDGCRGDSGAPLVLKQDGQSLVATSSFGRGCGERGVPAVYARVDRAMSFINAHSSEHRWKYPGKIVDDDGEDVPPPQRPNDGSRPSSTKAPSPPPSAPPRLPSASPSMSTPSNPSSPSNAPTSPPPLSNAPTKSSSPNSPTNPPSQLPDLPNRLTTSPTTRTATPQVNQFPRAPGSSSAPSSPNPSYSSAPADSNTVGIGLEPGRSDRSDSQSASAPSTSPQDDLVIKIAATTDWAPTDAISVNNMSSLALDHFLNDFTRKAVVAALFQPSSSVGAGNPVPFTSNTGFIFYSTGDLTPIQDLVLRVNTSPLHQRNQRFGPDQNSTSSSLSSLSSTRTHC